VKELAEVKPKYSPETTEKLKKWSEKFGMSEEEMLKSFDDMVEKVKQQHPTMEAKTAEQRARHLLYVKNKGLLRSPAVPFEGIILGVTSKADRMDRKRREARQLYEINPDKAIAEGLTDADGVVLDDRPNLGSRTNPNYGKKLQPFIARTVIGVGKPKKEGAVKLFMLTLTNVQADFEPPLGEPVHFRAIVKDQSDDNKWFLGSSTTMRGFEPGPVSFIDSWSPEKIFGLLDGAPDVFKVGLDGLIDWVKANENDLNRVCIVEGDAAFVGSEPTATGNFMLVLEEADADMEEGVTGFVDPILEPTLDFGRGSRVIVIGRPSIGVNPRTQNEAPTISVYGVWARPEFKVSKEEAQLYFEADTDIDVGDN